MEQDGGLATEERETRYAMKPSSLYNEVWYRASVIVFEVCVTALFLFGVVDATSPGAVRYFVDFRMLLVFTCGVTFVTVLLRELPREALDERKRSRSVALSNMLLAAISIGAGLMTYGQIHGFGNGARLAFAGVVTLLVGAVSVLLKSERVSTGIDDQVETKE